MPKPAIVGPRDTIDPDPWSIITSKRELWAAIRAYLADNHPGFLHELEYTTLDDRVYNDLPYAVDEIIDHIKEQQQ